jgi:hypothetical protein
VHQALVSAARASQIELVVVASTRRDVLSDRAARASAAYH